MGTRTPRPAPTADHLLSAKKPTVIRDYFGVPEEEAVALINAKQTLDRARTLNDGSENGEARVKKAKQVADDARDAVRNAEGAVEVVMRSVGRGRWEKLKEKHPPTEEQIEEVRKQAPDAVLPYNHETFPVAAIAASCSQPELTEEQVQEIWDSEDWNEEECARLFQMALQANETRRAVNLAF